MAVYLRANTYWYDFTVAGKRFRGSTGLANQAQAKKFESDKIKQLKEAKTINDLVEKVQRIVSVDSIPLETAYDVFMSIPRKTTQGKQRQVTNAAKWADFAAYMRDQGVGMMNLVTRQHAENYIQHLRTKGRYVKTATYKRGRKTVTTPVLGQLSVATVNDFIVLLKMVFNVLQERANIGKNPFASIHMGKKDTVQREAFSPEELTLIGEKSKGSYLYPLFLAGISTGLREGDICTLRWAEVDLGKGWINRKLNKTGKKIAIPILPGFRQYLLSLSADSEYCFPELASRYFRDSAKIGSDVTAFLLSIGIQSNIRVPGRSRASSVKDIHSLRHTFAYMAAVNNIPLPVVQSILGHFSADMTRMYSDHATARAKEEHMRRMPEYLMAAAPDAENPVIVKLKQMNVENFRRIRDEIIAMIKSAPVD